MLKKILISALFCLLAKIAEWSVPCRAKCNSSPATNLLCAFVDLFCQLLQTMCCTELQSAILTNFLSVAADCSVDVDIFFCKY